MIDITSASAWSSDTQITERLITSRTFVSRATAGLSARGAAPGEEEAQQVAVGHHPQHPAVLVHHGDGAQAVLGDHVEHLAHRGVGAHAVDALRHHVAHGAAAAGW
jgi:hypothetical protein